jgi:hypothetical protein
MSIVSETLITFLPAKRKITPSGWTSFNAPCCVHNGTSADTRMRGGTREEGDTFSYHCFNCGFKASWQPGRNISHKLKQLMSWVGVPDGVINKLSLEVLKLNEGVEVQQRLVDLPSFNPVQLPPESQLITDDTDNLPDKLNSVKDYMADRQLWVDQGYEYYWSNSLGYRDRFIIPFYYEGQIVGWTARTVTANKKPKYITESQPGFVFNLDEQRPQKVFCIVVEGPIDAIHIDGVALMRAEINDQQAMLIDRLNRDVIVLPDRDNTGAGLIEQAITRGWGVSMPEWAPDIKDVNDAVLKYGRLYTLYSIVSAAESSPLKIRLRAKKWYVK